MNKRVHDMIKQSLSSSEVLRGTGTISVISFNFSMSSQSLTQNEILWALFEELYAGSDEDDMIGHGVENGPEEADELEQQDE